jgi:hypothetical protein
MFLVIVGSTCVPVQVPELKSWNVTVPVSVVPTGDVISAVSFGSQFCLVASAAAPLTVIVSGWTAPVSGQAVGPTPSVFLVPVAVVKEATNTYVPTADGWKPTTVCGGICGYVPSATVLPVAGTVLDVGPKTSGVHVPLVTLYAFHSIEPVTEPAFVALIDPGEINPPELPPPIPFVPGSLAVPPSVAVSLRVLPSTHGFAVFPWLLTQLACVVSVAVIGLTLKHSLRFPVSVAAGSLDPGTPLLASPE